MLFRSGMLAGSRDSPTWSRGKVSRSSRITDKPWRAIRVAAVLPPGPPPITTTSARGLAADFLAEVKGLAVDPEILDQRPGRGVTRTQQAWGSIHHSNILKCHPEPFGMTLAILLGVLILQQHLSGFALTPTLSHREREPGSFPLDGHNTRRLVVAPGCLSEPEHSEGEESQILRSPTPSE